MKTFLCAHLEHLDSTFDLILIRTVRDEDVPESRMAFCTDSFTNKATPDDLSLIGGSSDLYI